MKKHECDAIEIRRAYCEYRKAVETAQRALASRLPGWNVEIREHRKDSFEVLVGSPFSPQPVNPMVFYLSLEQIEKFFDPHFGIGPKNFFGFDLTKEVGA